VYNYKDYFLFTTARPATTATAHTNPIQNVIVQIVLLLSAGATSLSEAEHTDAGPFLATAVSLFQRLEKIL
jgi:hypothetical protein